MKVKIYNLKPYLESKINDNSRIVRFGVIAIVQCKNGIVILDNECCGEIIKDQGLEFVLQIPLINEDMICMSAHELPTIDITLKEIIDNCEREEKELKDFVSNPYKMRIQDNMDEAQKIIKKLNKKVKVEV